MAEARIEARPSRLDFDPFLWLWRLLTSVRFALALIGFLALASLLGVLIPQIPTQMRGNPAAVSGWLAFQEGRFGALTGPMDTLGLFDVFRSLWFVSGLGILVMSVCVCTLNRFAPIWRNVTRPQERVPDDYFERGQPTIGVPVADVESLASELRRRRFRVAINSSADTTYLFADRYPWAQLATFVSHLALILFLAGGLVTIMTARDVDILIAEGETRPVFNPSDSDHMQIYVEDAVGRFDATGFPLDYRTRFLVYKNGEEVANGVSTVNDPLSYGGYKFHQTAYFPDGAALRVREVSTGRLLYDEILALTDRTPAPRVVVRDALGTVLIDEVVIPTDFIANAAGALIPVPGTERGLWIGTQPDASTGEWRLVVFEPGGAETGAVLAPGGMRDLDGISVEFAELTDIASVAASSVPGAGERTIAELSEGISGKILTLSPVSGFAVALAQEEPVVVGDYEYTFLGQREFAGLTIRRDRGSTFIWVATGLLLIGLALTFYTPRRRLWAKISGGQAAFRGLGGRTISMEREVRRVAEQANQGGRASGRSDA